MPHSRRGCLFYKRVCVVCFHNFAVNAFGGQFTTQSKPRNFATHSHVSPYIIGWTARV